MRKSLFAVSLVVLIGLAPGTAKAAKPAEKAKTARVDHLGTLPAPAAIGANFKRYSDGKTFMFVTGHGGIYTYDVTDGDDPRPAGVLPMPHYENEDVSVGGNRLLISGDGTLGGSNLVVVDISDPRVLRIERIINMQGLSEGHTATCIQGCRYVWVAGDSDVAVLDLEQTDQVEAPDPLPDVQVQGASSKVEAGSITGVREFGWSTHDVQVDEAGIAWVVGGNGTVAFDVRPEAYGPGNLLTPTIVARTGPDALNDGDFADDEQGDGTERDTLNDFIHHNSWRPDAGNVLLVTEEDIWDRTTGTAPGGCPTQGSFQTWSVGALGTPDENTSTVKNLDSWTTEFNENPPAGVNVPKGFCSSHYFSERDGIVATAWYEQGTRFLDVSDPTDIEQVAFFLAPGASTWATYWSPTDKNVVYVADNQRGLDVLRFERGKVKKAERSRRGAEVRAPLLRSWLSGSLLDATPDKRFGFVCRQPRVA